MKKYLIFLFTIFSLNIYSQAHIGAMGGYNLDNDKAQVGLGLNYMLFSKIALEAMAMITPFEDGSGDDYMIMYNAKYKLGKFTLVGGLMDMKMGNSPNMNMDMNMDMNGTDPYFGIEFKPFKNKMLKVYYNHSDMMKSVGIMMPILHIGKKMNHDMHMNHDMTKDKDCDPNC